MSFFGFIRHEVHSAERSIKHTAKNFVHDISHAEKSVSKAVHHVEKQVEHAAKAVVHDTVQISKKAKQAYHSAERSIKHTVKHVTHEVAHAEKSVAKTVHHVEKQAKHVAKNVAHEASHAEKSVVKAVRHVAGQVEHATKKVERSVEHTAKNVAHEVADSEKSVVKDVRHVAGQVEHAAKKVEKSVVHTAKNVAHEVSHVEKSVAKDVRHVAGQAENAAKDVEKSVKRIAKHMAYEVVHAEKSVAKDVRHVAGQVENAAKDVEKSAANTAKNIAKAPTNAEKQAGKAVKQMKTAISKYTESMMAFGKHVGKDMADSKVAKGVENLAKHPLETGEALLSVVGGEVETVGGTVLGVATSETVVGAVVGGAAVLDGVNNVVSGTGDLASIFNGNLSKVGTHNFAENMTKKYGGQAGDIAYLTVSMGLGLAAAPEAELSKVKDLVNVTNGDIKLAAQGGKRLLQAVRSALDNGGESKLALAEVGEGGTVSVEGVKQAVSKSPVSLIKSGEHAGVNGTGAAAAKGTGELNKDLAKAYLRDVEDKTGRKVNKEQIHHIKEALRNNNYEKLTPKETAKHRSKFTSSLKDKLIAEWEEKTNQKWPRYTEDVVDKNGEVARSIGQPYDAHHIIENNFGGPHEWWNIHPAKYPNEHQAGIHGKGAPSGKLFPRR